MKTIKQRKFWLEHCNDEKYVVMRNTITEAFKDLIFDEKPHKYYLHGEELTCVSDITHLFVPHFDSDMMAAMTAKRNYNNPNSKYYQMTSKMIKESWKNISSEACYKGTQRHNFGESVFWWMVGQYDKIVPEFNDRFTVNEDGERICTAQHMKEEAILQFWDDLPDCYIPILAENKVFNVNDTYRYSGTFDILFYYDAPLNGKDDKYSGFAILDYKTNVDLYKNFNGQKMLEPFDDFLNMSVSVYKLQLAAYQLCLEKIGLKVIARRLIWLKHNGTYEKVILENLTKRLDKALRYKFNNK